MNRPSAHGVRAGVALSLLGLALAPAGAQVPTTGPAKPDPRSPFVKSAVLAELREPTQAEIEEIAAVLRGLASDDAQKRDSALKQVGAVYARMVAWEMAPNRFGLSKEELDGIGKVFQTPEVRKAAEPGFEAAAFARSQNLRDQPGYLIALLKETAGPDADAVVQRLEKITRQRLGRDVPAWEAWWSRQGVWGKFEQIAPDVGRLIRLEQAGGGLRLDRAHWSSVVAAMDQQKMREQFHAHYRKQFPDDEKRAAEWAKDATSGPDSVLVFRSLQLAAEATGGGRRGGVENPIRVTFAREGFVGELSRQGEQVRIVLEERSGPRRRLDLWDDGRGGLCVLLCGGGSGSALLFRQGAGGRFDFAQVDGSGPVCLRAPTFPEFCRKYPRLVETQLLAPLRRVGVLCPEIPAPASAPAEPIAGAGAALPDDPGKADWKKGVLQEVAGDVGNLVALTVSPKGLTLDRQHWQRLLRKTSPERMQEVAKEWNHIFRPGALEGSPEQYAAMVRGGALAMKLLQSACTSRWGMGGGSGSGLGFPKARMEISVSRALDAEMRINWDAVALSVQENSPPARRIEITDDGAGAVRLLVTADDDGSALLFLQGADGRVGVIEAGAGVFLAAAGKSFKDFSRRHRGYVDKHLLAYLAHLGLTTPPGPCSAEVTDAVLLKITGLSERDRVRAGELIAQLNASEFQKRQEAMRLLGAGFLRYRRAIEQARDDPSLPAETRERLAEVFRNAIDTETIEQVVSGMGLPDDVEYLVWLLGQAQVGDRKPVADRLTRLTGQRLGEEPQPWRQWWSGRGGN